MKFTSEHIQQLLVEKITGTIAADDDLAIEQLLTENKEVFLQWQAIQQQMQQAEAHGFSIETDVDKSWQQIVPLIEQPGKARVFYLVKVAVAAVAVAVTCIYLFNKDKTSVPVVAKVSVIETRGKITLSMDNGKTISLKRAASYTFKLGAATIQTKEGVITYTSSKTETQEWGTLSVPAILDYKIRLADGTEVWMNSETKLRFPFSFPGKTREVYIDGEAFLKFLKTHLSHLLCMRTKPKLKCLVRSLILILMTRIK